MRNCSIILLRLFFSALVILPLLLGGLIYVFFRSIHLIMFKWFESLGFLSPVLYARHFIASLHIHFPSWFIFSLPDALWLFSLTLFFGIIWYSGRIAGLLLLFILSLSFGLFTEFAQYLGIFPGSFDIIDICFQLLSSFAAIISTHLYYRESVCLKNL